MTPDMRLVARVLTLRAAVLPEGVAVDDLAEDERVDEAEQRRDAGERQRQGDQPVVRLAVRPADRHPRRRWSSRPPPAFRAIAEQPAFTGSATTRSP
jgi:hypothetical protein